jgi:hypothetical protein
MDAKMGGGGEGVDVKVTATFVGLQNWGVSITSFGLTPNLDQHQIPGTSVKLFHLEGRTDRRTANGFPQK